MAPSVAKERTYFQKMFRSSVGRLQVQLNFLSAQCLHELICPP